MYLGLIALLNLKKKLIFFYLPNATGWRKLLIYQNYSTQNVPYSFIFLTNGPHFLNSAEKTNPFFLNKTRMTIFLISKDSLTTYFKMPVYVSLFFIFTFSHLIFRPVNLFFFLQYQTVLIMKLGSLTNAVFRKYIQINEGNFKSCI